MSKLRVMRVIARMNVGGPALQVAGLARGLDPDRFEHRIYTGLVGAGEADYRSLRASDVGVIEVPGLGRQIRPGDDVRALRFLSVEMASFRPDIVHTHTAKAGVLGRLAAFRRRVPITVHTFHGHLLHGYGSSLSTFGVRSVERVLARRTTALVAVGTRVRDELLDAGIGRPTQYSVVPPGIGCESAPNRDDARRALDLPLDGVVVLFVARLTNVKRPDRVVEIARSFADRDDVTFVVLGGGELERSMAASAADLGRRFRMLGWRADVEVAHAAADLIVLTSDNEGMPVSLIEAAMASLPAVATDVGSTSEVVLDGRTGLLTSTRVAEIAAGVRALVDDPDRRREMGRAAHLHAEASFSVDRLVEDTEALYDRLAGPFGRA